MHIFLIVIHVLAAILLIAVVLIQRGRGGGLVESFSSMESMFGTKTSIFLTRATAILASIFLVTSISLALIAGRQTRSLIDEEAIPTEQEAVTEQTQPVDQASDFPVQEGAIEDKKPIEQSSVLTVQEEALGEEKPTD